MKHAMKIDTFRSIIAVVISALLSYAFYELCDYERVQLVITTGSFLTIGITSMFALAVSVEHQRSSVMLKALSSTTFFIEIAMNGIFAFFDFSIPAYIIINGLILVVFALIYNSIYRTKM